MVNAFKWRIQGNTYAYWTDINDTGFIITDQYDIADESKISDIVSRVENESVYEERYNAMAAEVKAQFNMDMLPYTYYFNMSGDYCGVGDDRLAYKGVGIYEIEAEKGVVDGVTGTTVTIYLDDSARTSTSFFVADGKDADVDDINEEIAELNGKVSTNTDSIIYLSGITDSLSGQIQSIINWQEGANSVISTSVGDINQWTAMTQSLSGYVYSDLQQEIGIMDDGIAGVNQKITQLSGNTTAVTQSINQQISTANSEISRVERLSYVNGDVNGTPVTAVTNELAASYSEVKQEADRIDSTVSNFKIGSENIVRRTSNSSKDWIFEDDIWTLRFHDSGGTYEDYKDAISGTSTDRVYVFDEYYEDAHSEIKNGVRGLRINVRGNNPSLNDIPQYPTGNTITSGIAQCSDTNYIDFTQNLYTEEQGVRYDSELQQNVPVTFVTPFLKPDTSYVLSFYLKGSQTDTAWTYTFITGANNTGIDESTGSAYTYSTTEAGYVPAPIEGEPNRRIVGTVETSGETLEDNAHGWMLHWNATEKDRFQRYWYTFKTGSEVDERPKLIFRFIRDSIYSIGQIQLEEGNTVSTWHESSMDVDKKFSRIEQTATGITLEVVDELRRGGIDITSESITLDADKVDVNGVMSVNGGGGFNLYDDSGNTSVSITSKYFDINDMDNVTSSSFDGTRSLYMESGQTTGKETMSNPFNFTTDIPIGSYENGTELTISFADLFTNIGGKYLKITEVQGGVRRDYYNIPNNENYLPITLSYRASVQRLNGGQYVDISGWSHTFTFTKRIIHSKIYYAVQVGDESMTLTGNTDYSDCRLHLEITGDYSNTVFNTDRPHYGVIWDYVNTYVTVSKPEASLSVIGHNGMYSVVGPNKAFFVGDSGIMFRWGDSGIKLSGNGVTPGSNLFIMTSGGTTPTWTSLEDYIRSFLN